MYKNRLFTILLALGIILIFFAAVGNMAVNAQDQQSTSPDETYSVNIIPELTGQIGGSTYALAWQNNYAYVGVGPRLYILDVSDPSQPLITGNTDLLPGIVKGVSMMGNYAYVADWASGLRIIDISNLVAPIEIGFYDTSGWSYGVQVVGNYAYVADGGNGLRIIDISNPTAPIEAGFYNISGATGVTVSGNYAYVANDGNGFRIVDISNPTAPIEVGFYDTPGYAWSVEVAGNYAYVADFYNGLRIVDISNPTAPFEVGFYDTPGTAYGVTVSGNYAYVADGNYGLRIVDISNPASPNEVGFYDTPGAASGVTVTENYAYVADRSGGLRIIDITSPIAPIETGFYGITPGNPLDVTLAENYAYVADGGNGLRIVDITDPIAPIEIGFYDTPGTALGVEVAGNYAYVADWDNGLRIIDISNPVAPIEIGFYNTPGLAFGVTVSGNYAYVADGNYGLRIVDISNPTAPIEVGFYDTPGFAYGVTGSGNYAYVADGGNGLRIVDISNPASPIEVGFYDTPGLAFGVTVSGNYAYVADSSGLRIIDIFNPAEPVETGYYVLPGAAYCVTVVGSYVYVAHTGPEGGNGLRIMDISNPAAPIVVGFYDTLGGTQSVDVVGNYSYVTNTDGGLVILRLLTDNITNSIPLSGGTISSTDGDTNLIFSSGAFTQTVNVTYRQLLEDENTGELVGIGHTFDISAVYSDTGQTANLAPGQTFTMTVHYSDTLIGPAIESTLAFYNWNGTTWIKEATSTIDTVNNIITATPDHLSLWAVLGEGMQADFVASPTDGIAPLTVFFTNTSSGDYTDSLWEFGDGVTSTLESPTHTYTLADVFTVTLTVSGSGGTDVLTRTNYIAVHAPVQADFVASPMDGIAPLTVVFTNTSSGDYTASLWEFGDGVTSTMESPTHIYTLPGVYTVTLTISGTGGTDVLTRTNYITVYAPVQADFVASPIDGIAPLTVVFTNTSSGDYTDSFWEFGDGVTSTLESPTHIYTLPGVYTVTLTISGSGGSDFETRIEYITVKEYYVYLPLAQKSP